MAHARRREEKTVAERATRLADAVSLTCEGNANAVVICALIAVLTSALDDMGFEHAPRELLDAYNTLNTFANVLHGGRITAVGGASRH